MKMPFRFTTAKMAAATAGRPFRTPLVLPACPKVYLAAGAFKISSVSADAGQKNNTGGIFDVMMYVGILIVVLLALTAIYRSRKRRGEKQSPELFGGLKRDSQNKEGPLSLPENHEAEITEVLLSDDPAFDPDDFLNLAREVFTKLQQCLSSGDLGPVQPVLDKELYRQQQSQLARFIDDDLLIVTNNIQIQRSYLHKLERDDKYDSLTVFMTVDMNRYTIDSQKNEVVDGNEEDILRFYYFLTFIRKRGVSSAVHAEGKEGKCPQCGGPLLLTDGGECENCRTALTDGGYGWVLQSCARIHNFAAVDNRGVIYY